MDLLFIFTKMKNEQNELIFVFNISFLLLTLKCTEIFLVVFVIFHCALCAWLDWYAWRMTRKEFHITKINNSGVALWQKSTHGRYINESNKTVMRCNSILLATRYISLQFILKYWLNVIKVIVRKPRVNDIWHTFSNETEFSIRHKTGFWC